MRVMIVGDTHGDVGWMQSCTKIAGRVGCRWIIQVGDFGWWPRSITNSGRSQSKWIREAVWTSCHHASIEGWIFLDGNHDDHDMLAAMVGDLGIEDSGLVNLGPCLFYAPRSAVFALGSTRFGALGGAVSIDAWLESIGIELPGKPYESGVDWFPEREAPTEAQLRALQAEVLVSGPIDVLLSHDSPGLVQGLTDKGGWKGMITPEIQARVDASRKVLSEAVVDLQPRLVVHGHWHRRYSAQLAYPEGDVCSIEGLAHNGMDGGRDGRAFIFIELPDLVVTDGRQYTSLKRGAPVE
jgi:predicted phosphodiesterase